jgi:DUF4097 and DUF4098 domain-containing protein YvlB
MKSLVRFSAAVSMLLALPLIAAEGVKFVERPVYRELPLDIAGSFWLDNPVGNIEITGGDGSVVTVSVVRTIIAADNAAAKEARQLTKISLEEGDSHMRVMRTIIPPNHDPRWSVMTSYVVRVPRTVHVRIGSNAAEKIHVADIIGNVTVKAFNGTITLDSVRGASAIETVNGRVVYNYTSKPMSNAQVSATNAMIEFHLPADSNFDWIGESLRNDFFTTFPARVRYIPSAAHAFRASINSPGGPTFTTSTILGSVQMLANGTKIADARSVFQQQQANEPVATAEPNVMRHIQLPIVAGALIYDIDIADLHVGEVRGNAQVTARAGSLELDRVWGECAIESHGGPLTLGEIMHRMNVHTAVGNINVRAAREGGSAATDGGSIRVLFAGGPITLRSGGGDIVIRQAGGAVYADTRSGDINITMDPTQKTAHVEAKTGRGNIMLNVNPSFAADIDATVLTSDPDADVIHSDFNGLLIKKEQVGSKTKVHAVGKINGGGERLEMYAIEGTVSISQQTSPVLTAMP